MCSADALLRKSLESAGIRWKARGLERHGRGSSRAVVFTEDVAFNPGSTRNDGADRQEEEGEEGKAVEKIEDFDL